MEFEVGAKVGAYEIIDVISSSKTEVTYRVRNTQEHRIEAMRVLPLAVAGDQDTTERFLREMRVHAQLSHPNILVFFATMQLERRLVMTTEFVEGVTLAEKLKSGPLPWKEAVELVSQALSALGHAHARGVVHRDVTPKNIVITPEGKVKLADFGLAKATSSPQLTQVGAIVGTLYYMSPEQVRATSAVDARSDLYSLALVLYEAVVGKVPFDYRSQFDVMSAQVSETPKPPSTLNQSLPVELDAIILKAAAKAPADRFQSAEEFRAALEKLGQAAQETASLPYAAAVDAKAVEAAPAQPAPAPESVPAPAAESAPALAPESAPALAAEAVTEIVLAPPATAVETPGTVHQAAASVSILPEPVTEITGQAASPEPVAPAAAVVEPAAAAAESAAPEAPAAAVTPPEVPHIPAPAPRPAAAASEMPAVPETLPAAVPAPGFPDAVPAIAVGAFTDMAASAAAVPVPAGSDAMPAGGATIPDAPAPAAEPAPALAVVEPPAPPEAVPAAPVHEIPAAAVAPPVPPLELSIADVEAALLEMASMAGLPAAVQNGTAHSGDALPACAAGSSAVPEVSPAVISPEPAAAPAVAVAAPVVVSAAAVEAPSAPNGTHTAVDAVPDPAPAPALLPEPPALLAPAPPPAPAVLPAPADAPVFTGAAAFEAPAAPAPAPVPHAEAPAVEKPPAAAPLLLSEAAESFPAAPVQAAAAPQAPAVLSGAADAAAPEESPAELPAPELVQIEGGEKPDEPSGFFADPRSPAWDGGRVLLYAATMSLLAVVIVLVLTR